MSEAIARKAGRLKGESTAAGTDVGIRETAVGATAAVFDEPVVTGNVDDFERIFGISVETY